MSVFSRIKTWTSEVLTASDLNAEFDNIITHMAPDGIEDASSNVAAMQETADPGGLGTESQATDLLGEIKRLRYVIKRAIGQAQWYINPGRSLATGSLAVATADIEDGAVTTAKIADGDVETAKINDGAVTPAKINLGAQVSSSSGLFSTANTSATDVTNLSVAFTASGTKNVFIEIVPDGSGGYGWIFCNRNGENAGMDIILLRDATTVAKCLLEENNTNSGGFTGLKIPASIKFLDASPAAGSYTYKVQVLNRHSGSSPSCGIDNAKLVVYEL